MFGFGFKSKVKKIVEDELESFVTPMFAGRFSRVVKQGKIQGTNLLDEIDGFQLYEIQSGTRDITVGNRPKFKKPPPYTGPYLKGQDIPGVPPHEQRIKVQPGSFPVIQF